MKKILCVMSDVGGGHRAAANAVHEALIKSYKSSDFSFKMVDLYLKGSKFSNFSLKSYPFMTKYFPWIYNRFYDFNNLKIGWDIIYNLFIKPSMIKKVKKLILEEKPDVILSTYAMCNRITFDALEELKLLDEIFTMALVLDLFLIHRTWAEPRADISFVSNEATKKAIIKYGVPEERIFMSSFPINPAFEYPVDKDKLRKEFGFSDKKFTVIIMGGGDGMGGVYRIAKTLHEDNLDVQTIFIAGRDQELFQKIKEIESKSDYPWAVFSFTDRIPELMSISDILISKPGPATIWEAVSKELPIIISAKMPRQEQPNVDFVLDSGFGYIEKRPKQIIDILKRLVNNEQELRELKENTKKLKKTTSAYALAKYLMEGKKGISFK
jgi:processive 1,2-diacylglycerol beta-glucosyltransferase